VTLTFDLQKNYQKLIFTACHKASFASTIYATANQSKACFASTVYATASQSVCPSHCSTVSKQENAEGCGFHRRVAQCLYFSDAKNGWWGWPCPGTIRVQRGLPLWKQARCTHFTS